MDIAIDSNIIRKDFKLKDRNLAIVLDYLKRTNSKIVLPQISFEESVGLYKRFLTEKLDDFNRAYDKLEVTLSKGPLNKKTEININEEISSYEDFLLTKLKLKRDDIVEYKDEYLSELVKRAINRKKPLDGDGQQFRDGLLWLTLLDYANKTEGKRLIFISDNSSDFAEKSKNELHRELVAESREKNVEIIYFKGLADFVKEHASKIDFVTEEWIKENIDFARLETIFQEVLSFDDDHILDNIDLERNESTTGHLSDTSYIQTWLEDYYLYEMTDGTIILNIEVQFEKEYEVEIEREKEDFYPSYEYRTKTDPTTGDVELEQVYVPRYYYDKEHSYKHEYPLFRAKFALTIQNQQVINYEFKDWDWG